MSIRRKFAFFNPKFNPNLCQVDTNPTQKHKFVRSPSPDVQIYVGRHKYTKYSLSNSYVALTIVRESRRCGDKKEKRLLLLPPRCRRTRSRRRSQQSPPLSSPLPSSSPSSSSLIAIPSSSPPPPQPLLENEEQMGCSKYYRI